jgi:hypothetical protein
MKIIKNFSKFPIFEKVAEFPIFEKVSAVQDKIRKAGNTSDPLLLRICAMEDVSPELNWNLINDEEGLLAKVSSEYENKIKGFVEKLREKYSVISQRMTYAEGPKKPERSSNDFLSDAESLSNLKKWKSSKSFLSFDQNSKFEYQKSKPFLYLFLRSSNITEINPDQEAIEETFKKLSKDHGPSIQEIRDYYRENRELLDKFLTQPISSEDTDDQVTKKYRDNKDKIDDKIKQYKNLEKKSKKKLSIYVGKGVRGLKTQEQKKAKIEELKNSDEYKKLEREAEIILAKSRKDMGISQSDIDLIKSLSLEDESVDNISLVYEKQSKFGSSSDNLTIRPGWNLFPGLLSLNSPSLGASKYDEDIRKFNPGLKIDINQSGTILANAVYGSGWCTTGPMTATGQLREGDFWVYFDGSSPMVAIRISNNKLGELQGFNNNRSFWHPYVNEIIALAEKYPYVKSLFTSRGGNATLADLKRIKERRTKIREDFDKLKKGEISKDSFYENGGDLLSQEEISHLIKGEDEESNGIREKIKEKLLSLITSKQSKLVEPLLVEPYVKKFSFLLEDSEVAEWLINFTKTTVIRQLKSTRAGGFAGMADISINRLNDSCKQILAKDSDIVRELLNMVVEHDSNLDVSKRLLETSYENIISFLNSSCVTHPLNKSEISKEIRYFIKDRFADEISNILDAEDVGSMINFISSIERYTHKGTGFDDEEETISHEGESDDQNQKDSSFKLINESGLANELFVKNREGLDKLNDFFRKVGKELTLEMDICKGIAKESVINYLDVIFKDETEYLNHGKVSKSHIPDYLFSVFEEFEELKQDQDIIEVVKNVIGVLFLSDNQWHVKIDKYLLDNFPGQKRLAAILARSSGLKIVSENFDKIISDQNNADLYLSTIFRLNDKFDKTMCKDQSLVSKILKIYSFYKKEQAIFCEKQKISHNDLTSETNTGYFYEIFNAIKNHDISIFRNSLQDEESLPYVINQIYEEVLDRAINALSMGDIDSWTTYNSYTKGALYERRKEFISEAEQKSKELFERIFIEVNRDIKYLNISYTNQGLSFRDWLKRLERISHSTIFGSSVFDSLIRKNLIQGVKRQLSMMSKHYELCREMLSIIQKIERATGKSVDLSQYQNESGSQDQNESGSQDQNESRKLMVRELLTEVFLKLNEKPNPNFFGAIGIIARMGDDNLRSLRRSEKISEKIKNKFYEKLTLIFGLADKKYFKENLDDLKLFFGIFKGIFGDDTNVRKFEEKVHEFEETFEKDDRD